MFRFFLKKIDEHYIYFLRAMQIGEVFGFYKPELILLSG